MQELVFIKDTEQLLFKKFKIKIKKNEMYELKATCYGNKIDAKSQKLLADVKAITMHEFKVWQEKEKSKSFWKARVIVDI